MLRLTLKFLFGLFLIYMSVETGYWLIALLGTIPALSAMTKFMEGVTAAIIAMKEDPQ